MEDRNKSDNNFLGKLATGFGAAILAGATAITAGAIASNFMKRDEPEDQMASTYVNDINRFHEQIYMQNQLDRAQFQRGSLQQNQQTPMGYYNNNHGNRNPGYYQNGPQRQNTQYQQQQLNRGYPSDGYGNQGYRSSGQNGGHQGYGSNPNQGSYGYNNNNLSNPIQQSFQRANNWNQGNNQDNRGGGRRQNQGDARGGNQGHGNDPGPLLGGDPNNDINSKFFESQFSNENKSPNRHSTGTVLTESELLHDPAFCCPITQKLMEDPYILTNCGHSFEKEAIIKWLGYSEKCPVCNKPAHPNQLILNYSLKGVLEAKKREISKN